MITTSSTSTSGSGGSTCEVPGPVQCGPAIPGYPDPLLSYDPAALNFNALGPLPEEVPTGAGAGWLGPFAQEVTATAVIVVVDTMPGFCMLPDPVRVAFWSEDHCGLPADDPNTHAFNTPLADVQQEPLAGTSAVKLTVPLPANITIPFGQSAYAAIIMATSTTCAASFEPQGDSGPRAIWFGRTDADCDGKTDAALGWAYLDQPTDPSVGAYPYDLGFGLVLAQ